SRNLAAAASRGALHPTPDARAAAVSRLAGSATMFSLGNPDASSRTAFSWSRFVKIKMFSRGMRPSSRASVSSSNVLPEKSASSCFGRALRESGQKRSPLPPARMSTYNDEEDEADEGGEDEEDEDCELTVLGTCFQWICGSK